MSLGGMDTIVTYGGNDYVDGGDETVALIGSAPNEVLSVYYKPDGTPLDQQFYDSYGNLTAAGLAQPYIIQNLHGDLISTGDGADVVYGGTGYDSIIDYFSFTVTQEMIEAEQDGKVRVTLDVDHGFERGDETIWASKLQLYGPDGKLPKVGAGWSSPSQGGGGSNTWLDDWLRYNITVAGTYTVSVSNWLYWLNNWSMGLPKGVDYELQVSMESHPVSEFVFAPQPIVETSDSGTSGGQAIDADTSWFTLYNADIGRRVNCRRAPTTSRR